MGEKQLVFDAGEVTRFQMRCDHCHTDVTFNGESEVGPDAQVRCVNCGMLMAGVGPVAQAYRTFLRVLRETKRKTSFVITLRD